MTDSNFCQDNDLLWSRGIISRRGPRDNRTDCEVDIILIHVPTGTVKEFNGTWYNDNFISVMKSWILQFPEGDDKKIEISKLRKYCQL